MKSDLAAYGPEIALPLSAVAFRSAFRLGLPGQCNDSQLMDLWFSWDSRPLERRDRFELRAARIRPFTDVDAELPKEWIEGRNFESEKKQGYSSVTTRYRAFNLADMSWSDVEKKLQTPQGVPEEQVACICNHSHSVDWNVFCMLPLDERHLNPNWFDTLKRVLNTPEIGAIGLARADLGASHIEDLGKGLKRMMDKMTNPMNPSQAEVSKAWSELTEEMKAQARGE